MKLRDYAVENRQLEIRCCFFSVATFKNNSIASGLQYFIGLHIILCYGNFLVCQKSFYSSCSGGAARRLTDNYFYSFYAKGG
jgi:hypothetical protein